MKTGGIILFVSLLLLCSFCSIPAVSVVPGEIYTGTVSVVYRNITVYAPAVAETDTGYIGVLSTITLTIQNNGSGQVFVDTMPLTQIDMQGSARLAVTVASALVKNDKSTNITPSSYDYFFVVRTSSSIIGGPSAGAIMTVATVALLENWTITNKTIMTGMINPDSSIGPIGGIPQKIDAAFSVGATRFLVPKGQMTYTEMVIETSVQGGITQIISRPVTRNVSEYARDNYGMEVVEVEDINDALLYMTGHEFLAPVSDIQITTEQYSNSMKPLASTLLTEAKNAYQNASDSLNNSDIPNYFPSYYNDQITEIFRDAKANLNDADRWYNQEVYYTSTSKSFQSLINSHLVSYACEYFSTDDEQSYIQSLLTTATTLHTNKSNMAKHAEIKGVISLQCVGAAQERSSEADSYLADAQSSAANHDYLNALYKIAYAVQRSESVGWWLRIASYYNDTGAINNTVLTNLAEEYIDDAQQSITYSEVILQEMGKSSAYLTDAQALLTSAQTDSEAGYPAAALFEAFQALAKGNLALEVVDGVTMDKVDRARDRAGASISESRRQGIEPVLAVSYYEYGQSLANESSFDDALVYYKYSDLIAGALRFTSGSGLSSSRYIGIPEIPQMSWWPINFNFSGPLLFFFFVGAFGGLGIGLILSSVLFRKHHKKYTFENMMPRSIEDYYKKNK